MKNANYGIYSCNDIQSGSDDNMLLMDSLQIFIVVVQN